MRIAIGVLALLGLAASGCMMRGHGRLVIYERDEDACGAPSGKVVVIERGHVHGDGCGHYWYNGQWYHTAGHVHKVGCGHALHNGLWVLAGAVAVAKGHVHNENCGHYFHDGQWFFMRGHHHGPACGHHWDGHVWIAVRL